ncbi:MAG: glycosyltransferase family 2 protein [Bacteroidales bacterium]|nr:glycosyltransferase family 2 protein [Bacteroidales bacterium]
MEKPLISIVIPVKNGEKTIQKCLDAIKIQSLFNQSEVIIIDSGSIDRTLEILNDYPYIRIFKIKPEEFNHGATRNYGVSLANGEFVVMTVQDAWASNNNWLEIMYSHFKDEKVVAVVGQQVVPHEKGINPHQWYRPVSKPRLIEIYFENPVEYLQLSGKEQDEQIFYDDVNTMYRKSALIEIPFEKMEFGEDMLWMKTAISKGYKAVYDARSSVWHYHFQDKGYVYRSTFTLMYFKYLIFGYIPVYKYRLKDLSLIVFRNFKFKVHFKWIFHNITILMSTKRAYNEFIKYHEQGIEILKNYYKKLNPSVIQGKSK